MSKLTEIRNFLALSDTIGTAGQPTPEQFQEVKAAGYEVIVNLALNDSPNALPDEAKVVRDLGLEYVHIPVIWDAPKIEDAEAFFQTMQTHQENKVFVHCAANKRVSAFMYLYRTLCEGVNPDVAQQALQRLWVPDETWQKFIEAVTRHHKPEI